MDIKDEPLDFKPTREAIQEFFHKRLKQKEEEVEDISAKIKEVQEALHMVRYGTICMMSGLTAPNNKPHNENYLPSIHPAAASTIRGKRPSSRVETPSTKRIETCSTDENLSMQKRSSAEAEPTVVVPTYVAPKLRSFPNVVQDPRAAHLKAKRRFIVGNVSKWISPDDREDMSTHKWMLYVRGDKDRPDISDIVDKVRFMIHQSYHPNNVIDVTKPPFQLTRRGWGEFPARVQLFFKNSRHNKPVSVVHNLKLDKTYTGLQTFGAETCFDVWLQDQQQEKENVHHR